MLKHHSRLLVAVLALAVPAALASAGAAAASAQGGPSRPAPVLQASPAPAHVAPRPARAVPLRVPDPRAYAAQKAAANAAAARRSVGASAPAVLAPSLVRNWAGQRDPAAAPSDSTGAIGTTRYIELVNDRVGIYNRTSNTATASGPLLNLTGCFSTGCVSDNAFDVQIIWDPGTSRFYYATDNIVSSTDNFIDFGWSTTATPTLAFSDWCHYGIDYGATFPDYPKLGDTKDFLLVGVNNFNASGSYAGSQIKWMSKPAAGTTCPAGSTIKDGSSGNLTNASGGPAFTPVPANQTDTSPAGWAVARPSSIPTAGATFLTVFKVTKSATGTAVIPTTGTSVPVTAYKVPASAPQPGTAFKLDTSDTRPTQAVSAIDPVHGSVTALWTQHTVFGGAGAQVRWYEINPATHSVIQNGTLTSTSLYTFNGAISPDRRVNGTSKMFGGDMVINVNQSSASAQVSVKVASKIGTAAISGLALVATSAAADTGFDCIQLGHCRWGDYAGASPDPAAPTTGATGQVWGTSMLSAPGGSSSSSGWTTRNFAVKP